MAKRQGSFNPAAGFFSAPVQPEVSPNPPLLSDTQTGHTAKMVEDVLPAAKAMVKKEKRVTITFNIDESLDDKLSRFVFEKKMAKEKTSKTQVITDAIINYLK